MQSGNCLSLCYRAALEDIRVDLQERSHRWQEIEKICGFNIIINPGQAYLEQLLASTGAQQYCGNDLPFLDNLWTGM